MTTMKDLTTAQIKALTLIRMAGTLYAYNGVSITTAEALERAGLAVVTRKAPIARPGRGMSRYVADWFVKAV
jgi:hypothetical protein